MELNTEFNTFISIKDESGEEQEIEVLVNANGYFVSDRGTDYEVTSEIERITIDSIVSIYDNVLIESIKLTKKEKRSLTEKAHDYLVEEYNSRNDFYDE
jgi:hypothetical protein